MFVRKFRCRKICRTIRVTRDRVAPYRTAVFCKNCEAWFRRTPDGPVRCECCHSPLRQGPRASAAKAGVARVP